MPRIVLVADDSPTIQKRALGILKAEGFDVETVSNGVAAIKRLPALHPVVILADVSMPGRDGYEVCEYVKNSGEFAHVPVLLVASDMEPYDEARGARVRADGIIKKPFDAHELAAAVTKLASPFEAETVVMTSPVAEQPIKREPTSEFELASLQPDDASATTPQTAPELAPQAMAEGESLDYAPTLVHSPAPDFSAFSEGAAPGEPAVEETPAPQSAPQVGEFEMASATPLGDAETIFGQTLSPKFADAFSSAEAQTIPFDETPLAAEEPSTAIPFEIGGAAPTEAQHSVLQDLEAAHPEAAPEEPSAHTAEPPPATSAPRTMIFSTPLELVEPVWNYETLPPAPEPHAEVTPAEAPPIAVEFPSAPPESLASEPPPPPATAPSINTTSLDSFSLGEATAGHVHFASEVADFPFTEPVPTAGVPVEDSLETTRVGYAPLDAAFAGLPLEEFAPAGGATEHPAAELAPEVAQEPAAPEATPAEYAPSEAESAEPMAEEFASEVAPAESAPAEIASEPLPTDMASEAAPVEHPGVEPSTVELPAEELATVLPPEEYVPAEAAPTDVAAAEFATEVAPAEEEPTPPSEGSAHEAAPESVSLEPAPAEHPGVEPSTVELASEEAASAIAAAEFPSQAPPHAEVELPEAASLLATEEAPAVEATHPDAAQAASVEPAPSGPAEAAAPPPAFDWDMFYSIVHKTVVKMSPPPIPAEVVEEIARRLADEIASELITESSHPQV